MKCYSSHTNLACVMMIMMMMMTTIHNDNRCLIGQGLKGKLRLYLEKITLNIEDEEELGFNWNAENNI